MCEDTKRLGARGRSESHRVPARIGHVPRIVLEGPRASPSSPISKRLVEGLRRHYGKLITAVISAAFLYPMLQLGKEQSRIKQAVQAGHYTLSFERCGQAALEELQRELRSKIVALQEAPFSAETRIVIGDGDVECTATVVFQPKLQQDGDAQKQQGSFIPREQQPAVPDHSDY